jgi:hypothetical protein
MLKRSFKQLTSESFFRIGSLAFSMLFLISCEKIVIEKPGAKIDDDIGGGPVRCNEIIQNNIFTSVPNLDFEFWTRSSSGRYEDPDPSCFWATPNKSNDIISGIPPTVFKVGGDSAYSGNYAAMIKTGQWGNIITSGVVASGVFAPNLSNPLQSIRFGRNFVQRPKRVTGYYMYFPVQGDSCGLYCYVTKREGGRLDTIGFSRMVSTERVDKYRQFELVLDYKSDAIPEQLVIYFASSEGGKDLKGRPGTTLFIDQVRIEY